MSSRLRSLTRAVADALAGLVYPSLCLGCERRLPSADCVPVCAGCLRALPSPPETAALDQIRSREAGLAVARATALWAYDDSGTVRRVQHALKYGGQASLGHPLGDLMGLARGGGDVDLVVPVPLSRPRFLERGYNQSGALAEGLADAIHVELDAGVLQRPRPTRTQTRLSSSERWDNVAGAFKVPAGSGLDGTRVLLVDDVLTTGATLTAAAQALAGAGAHVEAAVLAFAGGT